MGKFTAVRKRKPSVISHISAHTNDVVSDVFATLRPVPGRAARPLMRHADCLAARLLVQCLKGSSHPILDFTAKRVKNDKNASNEDTDFEMHHGFALIFFAIRTSTIACRRLQPKAGCLRDIRFPRLDFCNKPK